MPADCSAAACVETCECQEGFVLDANECIPQAECGCVFEGRLHGLGEKFWGDGACTKRCVCGAESRRAVCRRVSCRVGEECRVEDGIQDCYPKSYGTCTAVGATHYETFDGKKFTFQGTCMYQLAGLCEKTQGLVDFQVLVQNGWHDKDLLSSIALVMVKVYGKNIVIRQEHPGRITVGSVNVCLISMFFTFSSLSHFFSSTLTPLSGGAEYFFPAMLLRSRATGAVCPRLIKMRFNCLNARVST